ncbi:MAG TPA: SpoIIE family protein phosphatase [Anaerolineae bacterium]|nr:SpoIIE family protein phosphatase [Anaerolineae bacterium]
MREIQWKWQLKLRKFALLSTTDFSGTEMDIDLRQLISHNAYLHSTTPLGEALHQFTGHSFEYMAVLNGRELVGLCARSDIAVLLGSQYGYSLFSQKPVREHLRPNPVCIGENTDIGQVFDQVFNRDEAVFYEDVLLVDCQRRLIGLISTQTLVRLQNRIHLENIRLLQEQQREILQKSRQIEADLRMSRELQQALLTDRYPSFPCRVGARAEALRFHHAYQPFGEVGGDFFHIKQVSDVAAGVFIADVMGHGVRSALVTSMLRALLEEAEEEAEDPGRLLEYVNGELTRILTRTENGTLFVTGLYLLVDATKQVARYATAGHPLPVHVRRAAERAETLDHVDPGTVLGIFEDAVYGVAEHHLEPRDVILLYTDGIVEVV